MLIWRHYLWYLVNLLARVGSSDTDLGGSKETSQGSEHLGDTALEALRTKHYDVVERVRL
jgi:hypothetical protein